MGTTTLDAQRTSGVDKVLTISKTADAVNWLDVASSATGDDIVISTDGADSDVGLVIDVKGAGNLQLGSADLLNLIILGLPTSDPSVVGAFWLDSGVMTISSA